MLHGDYTYQLVMDRTEDARREIEHNRLEARLAKARLSKGAGLEEAVPRKSLAARSAAVVMALFR